MAPTRLLPRRDNFPSRRMSLFRTRLEAGVEHASNRSRTSSRASCRRRTWEPVESVLRRAGERKSGHRRRWDHAPRLFGRPPPVPTVKHCETELQDLPDGVDNSMEGVAVLGKMLHGIDPALFERLADGA